MFRLKGSLSDQLLKHVSGTSSEIAHFWDPKIFTAVTERGYKLDWYYYNINYIKIYPLRNTWIYFNPLNPELNLICYLLALLAHHFLHVSRIRVKSLTLRLLMSYTYMEHLFLMFLDHTQRRSTVGRTPLDE